MRSGIISIQSLRNNKHGWTPINYASWNGYLDVVKYLHEECHATITDEAISKARSKDIREYLKENSIHEASSKGNLSRVRYLYEECHANVEAKSRNGRTPINYASTNDHLDVAKYLHEECHATITDKAVSKSRNLEIREYLEENSIHIAASKGNLSKVKHLYEERHSNVEITDSDGNTPIILAAQNGHLEVVKYLHEECHATITDKAISEARNDEIRRYLQSKR
jgi:ankyrin repeat protein